MFNYCFLPAPSTSSYLSTCFLHHLLSAHVLPIFLVSPGKTYEEVLQMSEDFPYVLNSAISSRQTCLHLNLEVKYNFGYFFLACLHGGRYLFILCSATDMRVECLIFSWKSLALFGIYLVNRCLITLLYYRFDKL